MFTYAYANANLNCESLNISKTNDFSSIYEIIRCQALDPEKYTPNWFSRLPCGEHLSYASSGENCINDNEVELASCETPSNESEIYCFNGLALNRDSANLVLMYHLCNNHRIDSGIRLVFGACDIGQVIQTEDINCYCQFQNGDENKPAAFHCTGI